AAEKPPFEEGRFDKGELKYVNRLPVLSVEGTPEEMGRQEAALTGTVVKVLAPYPQQLMTLSGRGQQWDEFVGTARKLMSHATQAHRDELQSFAVRAGISLDLLVVANTITDLHRGGFACSSLMVEPSKSETGGILFGRNLDFYSLGVLDRYGLITVYRPKGKHAFATIGFPGVTGCISGMNNAGLALAVHEVRVSADGSPMLNSKGMPYALAFRRILEECKTIEDAEELLRKTERSTILSLAVCDRRSSGVLEITPKNVVLRRGSDGICVNTNHFRSEPLSLWKVCPRYALLSKAAAMEKLGVADVFNKLDEVNMGPRTVQSMVFEPEPLVLHVAMGTCPATKGSLKKLELKPFFDPTRHE
ncbi:MAG: C45 family autoproteolytic acyltransferase/hydolase, partial [Thermoguttaceae bacterium]